MNWKDNFTLRSLCGFASLREVFFIFLAKTLRFFAVLILFSSVSCKKLDFSKGIASFSEDFESYSGFGTDQVLQAVTWEDYVQIFPENTYGFDTNIVHSGNRSFRFTAIPT